MAEAAAVAASEYVAFELLGGAVLSSAAGIAAYALTTAAITIGASYVLGDSQGSRSGGTVNTRFLNATVREASASRRLIFGEVKTGGILVYAAQPLDGVYAHLATYLSEGEIEAIDPVFWIGEDLSTDAKFTGLLQLEAFRGQVGQVASSVLISASGGELDSTAIGTGTAYARTRYEFERNAFSQGLLLPTFLVRGIKCYDPRTGLTAFTKNPSVIMLYMVQNILNEPLDRIDMPSFIAAANIADEILVSADPLNIVNSVPNRVRRYEINGVFELSGNTKSITDSIAQSCGGALVDTNGKYHFYVGAIRPATGSVLTGEFLRSAPSKRTHPSRTQRIDVARGKYREPRQDWQAVDYAEQRRSAVDTGDDAIQQIDFSLITNGAIAQRVALQQLRRSNSAVPLVLPCNYAALQWQRYDVINVQIPDIGVNGNYLITDYAFNLGGGIDLTCVPHAAADYAWDYLVDEKTVTVLVRPDFNNTPPDLTTFSVSGAVIADGSPVRLTASWTAPYFVRSGGFLLQWKLSADSDWLNEQVATSDSTTAAIFDVIPLETYDVRIRMFAVDDIYGDWSTVTDIVVAVDNVAPSAPTALSVTGSGTLSINWTNPADVDFKEAKIYRNTVNSTIGATLLATKIGAPSAADSYAHTPGVLNYYWVLARDTSGNESSLTFAGSGS